MISLLLLIIIISDFFSDPYEKKELGWDARKRKEDERKNRRYDIERAMRNR